jgi:hypothetical protein
MSPHLPPSYGEATTSDANVPNKTVLVYDGDVLYSYPPVDDPATGTKKRKPLRAILGTFFCLGSLSLIFISVGNLQAIREKYILSQRASFLDTWTREHRLFVEDCTCRVESFQVKQKCSTGTYFHAPGSGDDHVVDFACTRSPSRSGSTMFKGTFEDLSSLEANKEEMSLRGKTDWTGLGTVASLWVVAFSLSILLSPITLMYTIFSFCAHVK